MVVGDNGIIAKAQTAKEKTNDTQEAEENQLKDYENTINEVLNVSRGEIKPTLVWTNPSPYSDFGAQTISLDLSKYKYVIITIVQANDEGKESLENVDNHVAVLLKVGANSKTIIGSYGSVCTRTFNATSLGVIASIASGSNNAGKYNRMVPLYIYGIESDFDINL